MTLDKKNLDGMSFGQALQYLREVIKERRSAVELWKKGVEIGLEKKGEVPTKLLSTMMGEAFVHIDGLYRCIDSLFELSEHDEKWNRETHDILLQAMTAQANVLMEAIKTIDTTKDVGDLKAKFDATLGELHERLDKIRNNEMNMPKQKSNGDVMYG